MLMFDQKAHCIAVLAEHLHQFESEEKHIPRVTCDELWVCCFAPESEWSSMEWSDKGSPQKKNSRQRSAGKNMTSVFWDSEGVIHDFLPHGATMNAQNYSNLLCNNVHQVIWKKRPRKHIDHHPSA
jgi:hypothetical protein